ncbi:MAG: methyltransferase domain-containing protein [Nannocystaceae bacterium]
MPGDYLLGTQDDELRRLGSQHRVWAEAVHASWKRAGFGTGDRIADLGCGPGFSTVDLGHLVGASGCVVGIDGSDRFLKILGQRAALEQLTNIETVCGDVQALELEEASLDGAYARWIFCFLSEPRRTLCALAKALRPGARLVVLDYFNYTSMTFAPPSVAMGHVLRAVKDSWRAGGGNLDIQAELPRLGQECGFALEWVRAIVEVARPGEPTWEWPRTFFANYVPRLVAEGRISDGMAQTFAEDWREREGRADTFLQLPPMYEIGLRRVADQAAR